MERFWTVTDVSTSLRVHPQTVKRWLRAGKLRGISLGDRAGWRIPDDAFQEFLSQENHAVEKGREYFADVETDLANLAKEEARLYVLQNTDPELRDEDREELFEAMFDKLYEVFRQRELSSGDSGDEASKIAA